MWTISQSYHSESSEYAFGTIYHDELLFSKIKHAKSKLLSQISNHH